MENQKLRADASEAATNFSKTVIPLAGNSSSLSGVQMLCLKMIVLAIQDLHLESEFANMKEWFVLPKSRSISRRNVVSALSWVFNSSLSYCLSYANCCAALKIDSSRLRELIFNKIETGSNESVRTIYNDFFMVNCK